MRVLFDQGTPKRLRRSLHEHTIETAYERGWSTLDNGELIAQAESAGFDALLTTDRQLRYQQNPSQRRLAIVVLSTTQLPRIRAAIPLIQSALDRVTSGSYLEIEFPERRTARCATGPEALRRERGVRRNPEGRSACFSARGARPTSGASGW